MTDNSTNYIPNPLVLAFKLGFIDQRPIEIKPATLTPVENKPDTLPRHQLIGRQIRKDLETAEPENRHGVLLYHFNQAGFEQTHDPRQGDRLKALRTTGLCLQSDDAMKETAMAITNAAKLIDRLRIDPQSDWKTLTPYSSGQRIHRSH